MSQSTCKHCGYLITDCHCGRKKNTSGEYIMYQNYTDYRKIDDYAMTSRINKTSPEERKIMEELQPMNGESLYTFIKRTDLSVTALIKYSSNHHLYGTKRVWSCHTSSRYCFICTSNQYLQNLLSIINALQSEVQDYKLKIEDNKLSLQPGPA